MKLLLPKLSLNSIFFALSISASISLIGKEQPDSANSAANFTLKQAQAFALINHYSAVNSELDVKIAKKKIWETTAMGLPQISGSASYRNSLDLEFSFPDEVLTMPGNEFMAIFGADNVSQGKLEVSQLIFDGSYIVALQASRTFKDLAENQKERNSLEVTTEVARSYHLVLVAGENVDILEKNLTSLKESMVETEALVKVGFLEGTDLDQLQLMSSKLTTSLGSAKVAKNMALKMLKLSMGLKMDKELTLKDNLETVIEGSNMAALTASEFNLNNNPDYKLLTTQRKIQNFVVKRNKMERLPSLAAFYQYTNTAYQLEFDFYKDANWLDAQNIGLSLNIPIWSSGMQGAKIKQAQFELMKLDNSLEYYESALTLQHTRAVSELKIKIANEINATKSIKLAQKIYDRTTIKRKEGLASSFELLQMKNQLLETQGTYIQSIFELLNAKVELDKLQNKL
jgi:outer membrane protein